MDMLHEPEYVTREVHDLKMDRLEAIMESNLAKHEALAADIRLRHETLAANMKADIAEIKGEVKAINARIDGIMDAIVLTNTRIDDLKSSQSNDLAKWGIIIAVVTCAVQIAVSVILRFWG